MIHMRYKSLIAGGYDSLKINIYRFLTICCLCFLIVAQAAASESDEDAVTILAVGDVYIGGSAEFYLKKNGYSYPFRETENIIRNSDIALANLEAPLTESVNVLMEKKFVLKTAPAAANAIKTAGFDVVTLANNHIMDYGADGLKDTIDLLDKAGIKHTGAGQDLKEARTPAILNIKGTRVAFLAYSNVFPEEFYATENSAGTAQGLYEHIKSDIKNISKHLDILVVSFHWSEELARHPKEYQIRLAHLAIDNGADLVVGHHPHVIQGVERYKDGIVFYSLGNFAFGSFGQTPEGIMAIVKLSKGRIISAEIIPLNVNNKEVFFQPKPLQGEGAVSVIDDIRDISSRFGLILTVKEGKGLLLPGEMEAAANSR